MSSKTSAGKTATTGTRRIENGRLTKALTQDMTVDVVAPAMYDVRHNDEAYTVDVEGGSCECKDHTYRGDEYVCKHVIAASVRHAFRAEANTALVARVLAAVREHGCIAGGTGCAGPTQLGERGYPCPACVEASGAGEWVVYQRLVNGETPAGAPVAMTDGGQPDENGAVDVHGCATCSGYAHGDDDQCAECRAQGRTPVDETPL